jgi:Predicted exporters of the RND superfamily
MGIGIAIDFGIQTVSRYKEERQNLEIQESLFNMIEGVGGPMTIALIASTIGFTSLSSGRITFLSELGTILTLTTIFAYITALSIVPCLLVSYDRYISNYIPEDIYKSIIPRWNNEK